MSEIISNNPAADRERRELEWERDREIREEHHSFEERLLKNLHVTKVFLFGATILTLLFAAVLSVLTDASPFFTIVGLLPTVLATLLFLLLLEGEYKDALFWLTPLALCFLFLTLGQFLNELFGSQLDLYVLTAINIVLSYIILVVMLLLEYTSKRTEVTTADVERFKLEELGKYLHTVEDKCKAINFVIGRVYRASNGGTKELREKLRIPSEWYNEFNEIPEEKTEEQRRIALDILARIENQLTLLLKPEKEVLDEAELKELVNIARDEHGKDRIIDVLIVNDSDPVEEYLLGALDFCRKVKAQLEKLR